MKILSRNRVEAGEPATNGPTPGPRVSRRRRRRRVRVVAVAAAVAALSLSALAADYLVYRGRVHPGVEVAGTALSGLHRAEAVRELTGMASALLDRPIRFEHEGEAFEATAGQLGWYPDVEATVDRAVEATAGLASDLWTRIRSWFSPLSLPWVGGFDGSGRAVIAQWSRTVGREPQEGRVWVEGTTVRTSDPVPGLRIDESRVYELASEVLQGEREGTLRLPVVSVEPQTSTADVEAATRVAERLMDGPLTALIGEVEVQFLPEDLGPLVGSAVELDRNPRPEGLDRNPRPEGQEQRARIVVSLDPAGVGQLLEPHRRRIEKEPVSARFVPQGESVRIVPSVPGRRIDPEIAARRLMSIARKPSRSGKIPLVTEEAELTTEDARKLGIRELVSSFTTYHACCESRVTNIHIGADRLEGAIVYPGETFSLNDWLGERTLDKGYLPAPGIFDGILVQSVGGGISQLTTTTFNAVFFGGYPILEWKAHSYYISRYPLGREATLSWPLPDFVFENDTDYALLITTSYTEVSVTVNIYSTEFREVVATDPVITARTATGYWTLVYRIVREDGVEVRRDPFTTFYKNGSPLTEEEVAAQATPSPSPTPSPTGSPGGGGGSPSPTPSPTAS